ncbi:unnamed protein product [Linum trigynum]|uniref:Reverse transcriptase zinc-binding domain-containing protein n=1 Tax=Linum trigynum TaxID=586398 RepID=A0AAV2DDZ9_9ROSI
MVALPRAEGGLGFKDLSSWNKACLARHIWGVLSDQKNSLDCLVKGLQTSKPRHLGGTNERFLGLEQNPKLRDLFADKLCKTARGVEWEGAEMPRFQISKVGQSVRPQGETVAWANLMWKKGIPKNSLLVWLILLGRITTLDKVQCWNAEVNVT